MWWISVLKAVSPRREKEYKLSFALRKRISRRGLDTTTTSSPRVLRSASNMWMSELRTMEPFRWLIVAEKRATWRSISN